MAMRPFCLLLCLFVVGVHSIPPPAGVTEATSLPAISALLSGLEPNGFTAFSTPAPVANDDEVDNLPLVDEAEQEQLEEEYEDEEGIDERWLDDVIADAEDDISRGGDYKAAIKKFRLASILGHEGAAFTAGALLMAGDGKLKRDIPTAIASLRRAADRGQPDAQALLGTLHASGVADRHGIEKSLPKALVYWTVAAGTGNVYASSALGFRHLYGLGVEKNCEKAARYYKRAASAIATDPRYWPTAHNFEYGDPPLASSLVSVGRTRFSEETFRNGVQTNADDVELFYYYRHSAQAGNADSMTLIGSLLMTGGLGQAADARQGREHLQRAAAEGHGEAHGLMGHLAMREGNFSGAMYHFRWSAGKNDRIGHYALGMIFLHGLGGMEKKLSVAAMHFKFAAERNHGDACFQLAMMHWKGEGVKKDLEEAYGYFEKAAALGNIQSKLNLGIIVLDGLKPVRKKNCNRAVKWFKEVAEDGDWATLFDLGLGAVERGDYYGSFYRHVQAAHAGIELGQYNAALLLQFAGGMKELKHWSKERVLKEAVELYEMSGIQGEAESYIKAGDVAYLELEAFERAGEIYNKAGEMNSSEGWFNLGLMYANGVGVEQSREKALWYMEKASEGDAGAVIAGVLGKWGLRIRWWARDLRTWWMEQQEIAERERQERMNGDGRSVDVRNRFMEEDIALVGGLLVVLITVLVVRGKRLASLREGSR